MALRRNPLRQRRRLTQQASPVSRRKIRVRKLLAQRARVRYYLRCFQKRLADCLGVSHAKKSAGSEISASEPPVENTGKRNSSES